MIRRFKLAATKRRTFVKLFSTNKNVLFGSRNPLAGRFAQILAAFLMLHSTLLGETSLSLNAAIQHGLAYNPEIRAEQDGLKARQAGFWQAISPNSPQLFGEVEGVPENGNWLNDYQERKLGFAQEIEFPLLYWIRGKNATVSTKRQQIRLDWIKQNLICRIKKQFLHVLVLESKQNNLTTLHTLTGELLEKARFRVLSGETAPYDSLKLSVERRLIATQESRLSREHAQAIEELGILIGWPNSETPHVQGHLTFIPIELFPPQFQVSDHPLVKNAGFMEKQAGMQHTMAWLDLMPSLELRLFQIDMSAVPDENFQGGEIGLSFPLWGLLGGQGKIRQSKHLAESARWFRILEENKQLSFFNKAKVALDNAAEQVISIKRYSLAEAKELVRIATYSYELGEMGYLEMVEAIRTLNHIQTEYVDALFHYYQAVFDLETATGHPLIEASLFEMGDTE